MESRNSAHYIDLTPALALMRITAEEQKRRKLEREVEIANISLIMPEFRKMAEAHGLTIENRITFKGVRTGCVYR